MNKGMTGMDYQTFICKVLAIFIYLCLIDYNDLIVPTTDLEFVLLKLGEGYLLGLICMCMPIRLFILD